MIEWEKVPSTVIDLANELIAKHHPRLVDARIGILFRSEAPTSGGKRTLGQASTITAKWLPLLSEPYDFIIWLAADVWLGELTQEQRAALLDHELCHCRFGDGMKAEIRPHDIEEFAEIIHRHGFWRDDSEIVRQAVQGQLIKTGGFVRAIFPDVKREMERVFDDVEVSLERT